ncbi:fumarylacetoacetate hydrolase family protein [Pseudonocardia ailaonensis]|uniref:Fumarylacetoacetate hydrolase family protein n=1 Tax=Pseudonocardia ailaonensis TaxID=367279 RepID=A0ABN2MIH9_9PSEU
MRIVTYLSPAGTDRVGVVEGDTVFGLAPGATVLDLLDRDELTAAGRAALASPHETCRLDEVTVSAPLQPRSVRDCSAFLQHLRNCTGDPNAELDPRHSQFPVFYFSNPAAVIGPHAEVPVAPGSTMFDFELEVCALIGRPGHNIAPEDAEAHIAGYSVLVDWSARDLQLRERPLGLGPTKGKDTATTIGPALVTPDVLEPFRSKKGFALAMTAEVNGEPVTDGSWDAIDWTFADLIAYTSRGTTLRTGDVIGSGTVPRGCLYEHHKLGSARFRKWLAPGDQVRLAVDQLGEITQTLRAADPIHPLGSGY